MPSDIAEIGEVETFLQLVREGSAELVAAFAVGWTPLKLRKLKKQADFAELLFDAQEHFVDEVESTLGKRAIAGNRWAVEIVLYNRRPERWRPPAQKIAIEHTSTVKHEVVLATTAAARELLMEPGAVQALQRGAAIDVDSRD